MVRRVVVLGVALGACGDNVRLPPGPEPEPPPLALPGFTRTTYAAIGTPTALAIGDPNGDGAPDLIVVGGSSPGSAAVLLGDGRGAFAAARVFAVEGTPTAVTAGDFDRDGRDDIALTDSEAERTLVALGTASGGLGAFERLAGSALALSIQTTDLNADGNADLVVGDWSSGGARVYLGDGRGAFTAAGGAVPGLLDATSIAIADFDRDGILDVAVTDLGPTAGDSTVAVMRGRGDGSFLAPSSFEVGRLPKSIAVADVDADGGADLIVANHDGTSSLLRATGSGAFAAQQRLPMTGSTVVWTDLDGDGQPELVAADGNLVVVHVAADGTIGTPASLPCGCGRLVVGDFNGDGLPDLAGLGGEQLGTQWTSTSDDVVVLLQTRE